MEKPIPLLGGVRARKRNSVDHAAPVPDLRWERDFFVFFCAGDKQRPALRAGFGVFARKVCVHRGVRGAEPPRETVANYFLQPKDHSHAVHCGGIERCRRGTNQAGAVRCARSHCGGIERCRRGENQAGAVRWAACVALLGTLPASLEHQLCSFLRIPAPP